MSDLLSTQQAAGIIGITREAVWQAIKRGDIAAQRVGRAWVIPEEEARNYKKARAADRAAKEAKKAAQ